jgi:ribosomal protein S18 acetylase RimI-like enzyme
MAEKQALTETKTAVWVKPFQWEDWKGLWQLRNRQLVEEGTVVDDLIPEKPDYDSPYEQDYHRIDQVYLTARGNFWIAWLEGVPTGHIAAEDKGDNIELRHMYVRNEYRRLGIGSLLVQALINHVKQQKVGVVELWTASDGPGRILYKKLGFHTVALSENELEDRPPGGDQIRMRLALMEQLSLAEPAGEKEPDGSKNPGKA